MNRRHFLGVFGAGLAGFRRSGIAFALPAVPIDRDGERLVERWSWVMGQAVHVTVYASDDDAGYEAIAAALTELRRLDARLSVFDPASDLAALNDRAGAGSVRAGPELFEVLRSAERFRALTGGAFDPAVEPLMRAWGFRDPRSAPPTPAELALARAAVVRARVDLGERAIRLPEADTRLDLGGIAAGYGLDRTVAVLRRCGIRRALIDLSGDCYALGAPPGERGWTIGIADPAGGLLTSVLLRDRAVATSANTASVVRYPGVECGHVLDPATGRAAAALGQVSIIAPSGIAADALSTAMLVSGRRPPGVTEVIPVSKGPRS